MPRIRYFLISILCIWLAADSQAALAPVSGPVSRISADCGCEQTPNDPFDPALQFNFGYYRGQCVNTCLFRSAKVLSVGRGHIKIANLLHLDRFYTADIPLNSISEVDMGFEEFLTGISHVYLRFRFSKPVRLGDGETNTSDVIISAEGVPPKGEPYKFVESTLGRYLLAYRILSVEEAQARMVKRLHHSIKQFKLSLTPEQQRNLLLKGLAKSEERSFNTKYDLLYNNCATSAVDLLSDQVKGPPPFDWWNHFERGLPIEGYYGTLPFMLQWGLISSPELSRIPNLENEISI